MSVQDEDAVILLYHGVTNSPSVGIQNFSKKHIPESEFRVQMEYIADKCSPMTLRDMAAKIQSGDRLPPKPVAVTFDDTFLNNATVAKPILEETGVPATFFVTTGFVGTNRRFWVDRVEHAINTTTLDRIVSCIDGRELQLSTPQDRIDAVISLKTPMKLMPPREREACLQEIESITSGIEIEVDDYKNMSWDHVRRLDDPPMFEVGGHTVNHEILAYLTEDELECEIANSIEVLEQKLGRRSGLFAYPEGQSHHYNDRVIEVLKQHGITVCPSAIDGVNRYPIDPFNLKRIMVGFMGRDFPWPLEGFKS